MYGMVGVEVLIFLWTSAEKLGNWSVRKSGMSEVVRLRDMMSCRRRVFLVEIYPGGIYNICSPNAEELYTKIGVRLSV